MYNTEFFAHVLRTSRKAKNRIEAKMILQEAYEQSYHIFDHIAQARIEAVMPTPEKKRPLASVAMHFAEDHSSTSRLYETLRLYARHRVLHYTGLSWERFLAQPHDMAVHILETCQEMNAKDLQTQASAAAQWQNELNNARS